MINKSEIKVILLHGNGSCSPNDFWYPYIKNELERLGIKTIAKQFPDTQLAPASSWLPFLKNELQADQNTILIGHSSGALAAMRFAEENKIYGSILVGAYHTHLGIESEKHSGYFDTPWKWKDIQKNQNWIALFASTDDPWIPISEPRLIEDQLKCEYHEFNNQGHFGGDYDKKEFPELLDTIKQKIKLMDQCE